MRWLQATTRRRCWSSSGISSVSYTKVKVLYDSCLLDGSGFLSKIDLSLLQLEDFSAPSAAILSGIEYTRTHMMCELQLWISLQFEVGGFLSPKFKNSIRNWYTGIWMMCELVCSWKLEYPHAAILSGIEYTLMHMMCELLVWISLQWEVARFLSLQFSNSLGNWVNWEAYNSMLCELFVHQFQVHG